MMRTKWVAAVAAVGLGVVCSLLARGAGPGKEAADVPRQRSVAKKATTGPVSPYQELINRINPQAATPGGPGSPSGTSTPGASTPGSLAPGGSPPAAPKAPTPGGGN